MIIPVRVPLSPHHALAEKGTISATLHYHSTIASFMGTTIKFYTKYTSKFCHLPIDRLQRVERHPTKRRVAIRGRFFLPHCATTCTKRSGPPPTLPYSSPDGLLTDSSHRATGRVILRCRRACDMASVDSVEKMMAQLAAQASVISEMRNEMKRLKVND